MTVHYRHDGQAACAYTVRPPRLTEKAGIVDCGNCVRTDAYKSSVRAVLPPVPTETRADPADVPLLLEWAERLAG
jgi:hypothetical protein